MDGAGNAWWPDHALGGVVPNGRTHRHEQSRTRSAARSRITPCCSPRSPVGCAANAASGARVERTVLRHGSARVPADGGALESGGRPECPFTCFSVGRLPALRFPRRRVVISAYIA